MRFPYLSRAGFGAVIYGSLLVIFALHQGLAAMNIHVYFLDAYLDDLLVFPILLPVVGWIRRKLHWSDTTMLPDSHIAISLIAYSLWFELIAPQVFHWGTADPWDVAGYTIGAIGVRLWGSMRGDRK